MNNLIDKVAVITGATSGIGAACAKRFAQAGATVLVTGRNQKRGLDVVTDIHEANGKAEFLLLDISDDKSIENMVENIQEKYGVVDILFNNAGVYPAFSPIEGIERKEIDHVFAVNTSSLVMVTKHLFPLLQKSHGVILNNASIAGIQSFASGQGYAYAASKSAVIQFTRMFAKLYGEQVRSNCICPGVIKTPLYMNFNEERFKEKIPMHRVGVPDDIAKVANFLVSDDAAYMNGAIIPIDGGLTL